MSYFQKIKNKNEWQNLLSKALFKTFFHQLDWESFLEKQFRWLRFERYLYKDELLLSLARCKTFGRKKLVSHPFCEYGGPLPLKFDINLQQFKKNLFEKFKEPLKMELYPPLMFSPFFPLGDITALQPQQESYFIVEFPGETSSERIWQNLRKSTRQEIRRAEKTGLIIEQCQNKKNLKCFYKLYLVKARQHKIPAYPYSFFEYFFASPEAEIILAKKEKRVVAGSVFLKYASGIHYFINASVASFRGVNHLILWSQIKKYCGDINIRRFDLGGTRADSPLAVFKSGWHAEPLLSYELKNYKEGRREQRIGFARKIWGFLPIPLLKVLSPYLLRYKI